MPHSHKLLLVEDESFLRQLLAEHLARSNPELEILQAQGGAEAWSLYQKHEPAFCIIDLVLPEFGGKTLLQLVAGHHHKAKIMIFSGRTDDREMREMALAMGCLWKNKGAPLSELDAAIQNLISSAQLEPTALKPAQRQTDDRLDRLTTREHTILGLIGYGQTNQVIASIAGISPQTVQTHRRNIMRKLGIHGAARLTRYAIERGLARVGGTA